MEKVRKMVEGTRQIKRNATVTETFDAVTPRMIAAATAGPADGGELVPVGVLSGAKESKAFFLRRDGGWQDEDAPKRSWIPGAGWRGSQAATFA